MAHNKLVLCSGGRHWLSACSNTFWGSCEHVTGFGSGPVVESGIPTRSAVRASMMHHLHLDIHIRTRVRECLSDSDSWVIFRDVQSNVGLPRARCESEARFDHRELDAAERPV